MSLYQNKDSVITFRKMYMQYKIIRGNNYFYCSIKNFKKKIEF